MTRPRRFALRNKTLQPDHSLCHPNAMRILIVGASGTVGRAIVEELGARHEIIRAGSKSGDVQIDLADPASIQKGVQAAGH